MSDPTANSRQGESNQRKPALSENVLSQLSSSPRPIHLSAPDVGAAERDALLAALDSNWTGSEKPAAEELETGLRHVTGADAAVALASGTAALHLGLIALGVSSGDLVILPTLAPIESANAVRYVGAKPMFVDCDPKTGNIDPHLLRMALRGLANGERRPAAVLIVDAYGSCADYLRIETICNYYRIPIIEDASASLGATHAGRPAGSFGALAAVSFDNDRLVTGGGGGALIGSRHMIERARYLANQAQRPTLHFAGDDLGYSYQLSNLLAAVASAQLNRLGQIVERTRSLNARYASIMSMIPGVSLLDIDNDGFGNGWLSVACIDQDKHPTPQAIATRMAVDGIEVRPAHKPLHLRGALAEEVRVGGAAAEYHCATALSLPSGASMTDFDQERVISSLLRALRPSPDPLSAVIDLKPEINLDPEIDVRSAQPQQHRESQPPTQRAA